MSVDVIANNIAEKIKSRHLFAIFDRDGTLVPINQDPKAAILHDDVLTKLIELNSLPNIKVAILSARDLKQLSDDFKNNDIILGGNYGMEVMLPNLKPWVEPNAVQSRELLEKAKGELETKLTAETGVILEDHQLTLCLHWHLSPPEQRKKIHACIELLKAKYAKLLFNTLPTSYEIWPAIQWNKAKGIMQMVSMLKLNLDQYLILYVGDSDSDEPAFAWVNGHNGITVRVGQWAQSLAQFKIKSPQEVEKTLELLIANIKKIQS